MGPAAQTAGQGEPDSLAHLAKAALKRLGPSLVASLPKMALTLVVVLALNILLMTARTQRMPGPLAGVVSLLIFVTAAYTSVIPKTFFWVLILTFGRSMLGRVRAEGLDKVRRELAAVQPAVKEAWARLQPGATRVAVIGAGLGLILSNFLSRNNRVDKFAPAIVLAVALVNGLGAGVSGSFFVVSRTASKDVWRAMRRPNPVTNDHIYVFMAALAAGLLANGILGLTKSDYIGYVAGAVAIASSVALGSPGKAGKAGKG
ncbi:MAG: hypothetical protein ACM3WT_05165 [Bacillota bacterium]